LKIPVPEQFGLRNVCCVISGPGQDAVTLVILRPEGMPEHFFKCLRAVVAHLHAVTVRPFLQFRLLAGTSRDLLPQQRRRIKGMSR
jgi:hypothetical protein